MRLNSSVRSRDEKRECVTLLLLLLTLLPPVARGQNSGQTHFSGLLEGLVVHWPLDGSLEDVLSGSIGTARGGEIEFVSGAEGSGFGEAAQLRGGEYIEDSSNPSVLRGEGLSVSLWFRTDAASPGQTLFSKGRSDSWRISESENHGIEFKFGSQIIGTDALEAGLHFLVVVEDADEKEVQLWVDSNFEAAAAVDVTRVFQISPIVIGSQRDGAGERWRGLIDDVAIWNRALSEEDVKKIWADGNGRVLGLEDFDGDGLLDIAEHRAGTNPSSSDTDGDGLGDNVESGAGIWISELDTGTNPLIADSDGDGLPDGAENPQVASASRPPSDPNKSDTDGDGVPDFNESLVVEDPRFRISAVTMSGGDRLKLSVPSASYTYYVLFQSDSPTFEGGGDPVAGAIGNNGMLDFYPARVTRGVRYYRVGRFVPPVDLDEDGVDDFSEELDGVSTSPLNPASTVKLADGAQSIPDLSTLLSMSVDVSFDDENLANTQFVVKFVVANPDDGARELYFLNTQRHSSHQRFARATGLECLEKFPCINGEFSYFPKVKLGAERNGLFAIKFDANLPSEDAIAVFDLVAANLGVAQGNLAVRIKNLGDESIGELRAVGIQVLTDREIGTDEVSYRGLHEAYAFGRLRVVEPGQRPSLQDIAIFKTIPNDVPHIAGTITEQEQTPLSHVNLRAIQNDSPNAFIRDASISDRIAPLIGEFVYFRVRHEGYEIQKANQAEVDAFFADLRPLTMQVPPRDLTFT
ncbi:MAG: hypothetical protein KDN22_34210, partial [Verrucomicrobiae bacterium]|nr:hypothetical protein [Verrucomicrobiae bacterium]